MNLLLVFQLAIQSSPTDDVEAEADEAHFDTVQWWVTPAGAWRIRTFGVDLDVHLHHVAGAIDPEVLRESTRRSHEGVIAHAFELAISDPLDAPALASTLRDVGGAAALQVDRNGARFAFWNPTGAPFAPRSDPDDLA